MLHVERPFSHFIVNDSLDFLREEGFHENDLEQVKRVKNEYKRNNWPLSQQLLIVSANWSGAHPIRSDPCYLQTTTKTPSSFSTYPP